MVGTIPDEFLISSETNLVNAQLAATDKPEQRVAFADGSFKERARGPGGYLDHNTCSVRHRYRVVEIDLPERLRSSC